MIGASAEHYIITGKIYQCAKKKKKSDTQLKKLTTAEGSHRAMKATER